MTKQEAEKLLQALEGAEKQAMDEKQKKQARAGRPSSGKIW